MWFGRSLSFSVSIRLEMPENWLSNSLKFPVSGLCTIVNARRLGTSVPQSNYDVLRLLNLVPHEDVILRFLKIVLTYRLVSHTDRQPSFSFRTKKKIRNTRKSYKHVILVFLILSQYA